MKRVEAKIKPSILKKIKEDQSVFLRLSMMTGINHNTLYKWVATNNGRLTMYKVIMSISILFENSVIDIVDVEVEEI